MAGHCGLSVGHSAVRAPRRRSGHSTFLIAASVATARTLGPAFYVRGGSASAINCENDPGQRARTTWVGSATDRAHGHLCPRGPAHDGTGIGSRCSARVCKCTWCGLNDCHMRILHVLNHTWRDNGHVHVAVDLACLQSKMEHTVAIASGGGNFDALLAEFGVEHIRIDQRRRPLNLLKAILQFRRAIARFRPDIVHAHMMTSAGLVWPLRKPSGFRLITTVHNEYERSAVIMGVGDRVIAVSDAVRTSMERRGIPKAKLRVVLNGTIGSPRRISSKPQPEQLQRPAVVFVGSLSTRKGVSDLIGAFKEVRSKVPHAHLYLVGDGDERIKFEELVRITNQGNHVTFCGRVRDPRPYLLGADVFVLPSHADPAPLVIPEAREAGCAIIATAVDGIPELLEGGEAGILVPPRDREALAAALTRVLTDDKLLAETRARSQRNIGRMSLSRVAEETLEVYRDALTASGSGAGAPKTATI
jgi:glycosyltransferase involved in cell wall biosynthesis